MQPSAKNATERTEITLPCAILIYTATMLAILPLYAIGNQSDSFTPNLFGLAYLGAIVLISHTKFGKWWGLLVKMSTKKIFG